MRSSEAVMIVNMVMTVTLPATDQVGMRNGDLNSDIQARG